MNGQKNILSIIIAVVITVFGCYFFLPSYSSKQLEISYETTLQQNKKDYEKQIKSLETEILTLEKNVDYYKEKAQEAEAKKETKSGNSSKGSSSGGSSKSESSKSGYSGKSGNNSSNDKTYTYILNKNTSKFHYSWCNSVKLMKESNKIYSDSSRSDIIEKGYSPCKNCNP